jgi:hypothetical protein
MNRVGLALAANFFIAGLVALYFGEDARACAEFLAGMLVNQIFTIYSIQTHNH